MTLLQSLTEARRLFNKGIILYSNVPPIVATKGGVRQHGGLLAWWQWPNIAMTEGNIISSCVVLFRT